MATEELQQLDVQTSSTEPVNGYAVRLDGSWRAVTEDMELFDDEVFYPGAVPQWAIDLRRAAEERAAKVIVEDAWRVSEIDAIENQLMAIEEAESAIENGEEPPADLLPGTRAQWLSYRTKVRAWKEGNVNFPDATKRPVRPA